MKNSFLSPLKYSSRWALTQQSGRYIYFLFIPIVVFKLILISNVEMGSGGADAMEYARLARDFYWDTANAWDLRRGPGVPLLVNFFHLFAVPYRLGIEVLFILSTFYFALVARNIFPPFYIITASILAVFSPSTYTEEILMSDIPFAIFFTFTLTLLASLLFDIIKSANLSITKLILSGLMAGYLCTIRDEGLLIYAVLFLYAGFVFVIIGFSNYKKLLSYIVVPILTAYIFVLCISTANQTVHGFFAVNTRHGNVKEVHKVLYKVQGGNIDNNDLTDAQLKRAANLSPEFAKILPFLLSQKKTLNKRWEKGAKSRLVNEIQRGFISLFYPYDARGAEKIYAACAEQIYGGLNKGELETISIYPFGRGLFSLAKWMELPGSVMKMTDISLRGFKYRFKEKKNRSKDFNEILNRRTALIKNYDRNSTLNKIRAYLTDKYISTEILFFSIIFLISILSLHNYPSINISPRLFLPFLFVLSAVFLRVLSYSVLDVFLNEQKARHVVNMNALFTSITIFSIFMIIFSFFYFLTKKRIS